MQSINPPLPASRSFWWVRPSSGRRTPCTPAMWPCSRATHAPRILATTAGAATLSWTPMSVLASVVSQGDTVRTVSTPGLCSHPHRRNTLVLTLLSRRVRGTVGECHHIPKITPSEHISYHKGLCMDEYGNNVSLRAKVPHSNPL